MACIGQSFTTSPQYCQGQVLSVFILTQKTCPRLASIYADNFKKSWDFILQQISWWPRGSLRVGTDNNKHTYCRHFWLLLLTDWVSAKLQQLNQCLYSLSARYKISIHTNKLDTDEERLQALWWLLGHRVTHQWEFTEKWPSVHGMAIHYQTVTDGRSTYMHGKLFDLFYERFHLSQNCQPIIIPI